tara:strand:+ start:472 stop:1164 length:693 start_codon:yes stop_codon:yes gene_type:complete
MSNARSSSLIGSIAAATLFASIFFFILPEIDLATAKLFYTEDNGFIWRNTELHRIVDTWFRPSLNQLVVVAMALAATSLASGGRLLGWKPRLIAFVALSFALGPGLLVNGLLKNMIGRARPKQIEGLGGDKIFSAAFELAEQCETNCAFVSGDVAFVATTLSLVLLLPISRQPTALSFWFALTVVTGLYRMATGAHFLSDVVLAVLFSTLLTLALYRLCLVSPNQQQTAP